MTSRFIISHFNLRQKSIKTLFCNIKIARFHSAISFPPHKPSQSLFQSRFPHLRSHFASMSTLAQPDSNPPQSKTVRVMIKGRVQGVFYRNWTVENAIQLGLKGWVRNRRDGSVEALFAGDSDKVEEMERRCRRGPREAMVTGLQGFPCDDDPGTGFERRPTV
ncbi:acylphosphatase family [Euphorbia peplus]|nr:acylphosphatase family [Euphorbia peplus]